MNLLIVWYLAIKFDSPGCRKKQRLISSGVRKLQPPEWQRLSLACRVSTGGSNDDWKGGFQQVGRRRVPEWSPKWRGTSGVARSTSRDDKKTSGSHHTERERGWGKRGMLRSVRMASTRVREDLSPWSSLLSSAVSSANEVPRETRRDGSFLFRGRRSSFPRAVSSSWTNCLVTGVRPSLFGTLGIRNWRWSGGYADIEPRSPPTSLKSFRLAIDRIRQILFLVVRLTYFLNVNFFIRIVFDAYEKKKKIRRNHSAEFKSLEFTPVESTLSICLGTSHPRAGSSRLYLPNRFADDRERTMGPWSRKKSMEYLAFSEL